MEQRSTPLPQALSRPRDHLLQGGFVGRYVGSSQLSGQAIDPGFDDLCGGKGRAFSACRSLTRGTISRCSLKQRQRTDPACGIPSSFNCPEGRYPQSGPVDVSIGSSSSTFGFAARNAANACREIFVRRTLRDSSRMSTLKRRQTGVGDGRPIEVQSPEGRNSREDRQAGVRDASLVEHEFPEARRPHQMCQPGVGDRRLGKVQDNERWQFRQVSQAGVGEF